MTQLLRGLNEGVAGSYVEEAPETLVAANPRFFEGFDLVLATQARRGARVAARSPLPLPLPFSLTSKHLRWRSSCRSARDARLPLSTRLR